MEEKNAQLSIMNISKNSLIACFNNILPFLKTMAYPILGQFFGILIVLALPIIYFASGAEANTVSAIFIILGAVIGLPLFCHAFWRYMVKAASLNVVALNFIKKNELINFNAADETITKRTNSYVIFLLIALSVPNLVFLLFLLPLLPIYLTKDPATVLSCVAVFLAGLVLFTYFACHFALVMQAFAFNENIRPMDAIKKSFELTHNKIFKTFLLSLVLSIIFAVFSAITSIPIIGFVFIPIYYMIILPITSFIYTYWYLRLEGEKQYS